MAESSVKVHHECKLAKIQDVLDKIHANDKSALIMDLTENYFTFLKYKGVIIDVDEFNLKSKMNKMTKEEFIENSRKHLVAGMSGQPTAIFLNKLKVDFKTMFKEAPWFSDMKKLFTPSELAKEDFYKKCILKPEEDKDYLGNKGFFQQKDGFKLCVLFCGDRLNEVKDFNLPLDRFEIVKIVN